MTRGSARTILTLAGHEYRAAVRSRVLILLILSMVVIAAGSITIASYDFRAQLEVLKRNFEVIGLEELDDVLARRRGRAVMITFDDGYCDNYTHAFSALRDLSLPATFFVTTGFLDDQLVPWWDEIAWMVRTARVTELPQNEWLEGPLRIERTHSDSAIARLLRIYKGLRAPQTVKYLDFLAEALQTGRSPAEIGRDLWMTWDMVREMRSGGMTIGGHSVTHPVLATLSDDQQDFEVRESRRRLVEELGEPIDAFSYPVGGGASFNEITINAVKRHGYRWGFTYLGGYLKPGRFNRYALRRTAIETEVDLSLFRAMMALPQMFS